MIGALRHRFATVAAAAPRAYWFVWWGTLVNRLGGFVVPLLTIYLTTERHLSVSTAGGIIAMFGAGQVVASIVGGQMSDRIGRRATMLVSLFGGAAAMFGLGLARDLDAIMVMVGAVGFVGELYRPAVLAFVADVVPPEHRIYAYGLLYWAINLGFAFAAVVGGLLADLDFSALFYADAATMLIYGVIVAVAVPETRPARPTRVEAATERTMWRDRELLVFLGITFLFALMPMQAGAALSAHMMAQGFTPAAYGLVMGVNGVMIIALQPALAGWSARFDPSRMLAGATLLTGIGMFAHGLAPVWIAHAGAVAIWTIGEILESPTRSTIVAGMAPTSARGRYQGALVTMWGLSQLVGPKVGTWLWEHEGPSVLWTGCLGLSVIVAALLLISAPARRRRTGSS